MQLEDEIGDIIAKARIGHGWTSAQLAAHVGASEREIDQIESYRLMPNGEQIEKLGAVLELNTSKLLAVAAGEWSPKQIDPSSALVLIEKVPVSKNVYGSNAYIVACRRTNMAAVVDPGDGAANIEQALVDDSLILSNVLVTHTHSDHIGALRQLLAKHTGVIVSSATIDRDSTMRGLDTPWQPADDGFRIDVGEIVVTAISTPGHTAGSTCYSAENACFTGDTIFAASIGRPSRMELYQPMLHSIRTKLLSLPPDTVLLPGHGPTSTVAQEIEHNPFF